MVCKEHATHILTSIKSFFFDFSGRQVALFREEALYPSRHTHELPPFSV